MGIKEILEQLELGELSAPDLYRAYGKTNKDKLVWLPQTNDNENWVNVVLPNDDYIIQIGKKESKGENKPEWEPAIVILRDKSKDKYKRLPDKYRPVYRDSDVLLTIHAKENLPVAQGNVINEGNISRVEGFVTPIF